MLEHVHLLVSEPAIGTLAKAIYALTLFMSKLSPNQPFWQAHYYDFNLFSTRKHVAKLR
jgi:putative transposase